MAGKWTVEPTDPARKGAPWLVLRVGRIEAMQWNGPVLTLDTRAVQRLGPDLLAEGTDTAALVPRLRRGDGSRPLGEVLQDQRLIAGIGNMWMSETLWEAGLSPWLPVSSVSDEELFDVLARARGAMRSALTGPRPRRSVYRRAGRPCRRCGELIRARGQGENNRTVYWCRGCQREPSPVTP
jgi:endonuclease-8